ncbi:palmitoyltransferase ZDHHC17-like [Watersipora subatra]|uniref:palmitoyltransferase ZDHHC17-like n=1 Tax=Watersipora subatra TaxID=2589382 RepID=UPI00355B2C2F
MYAEFEKQQELLKQSQTTAPAEDPSTYSIKKATQFGCVERVKQLVQQGADVNELDAEGSSLLHWAAINNQQEIAGLYIDNGAVIDKYGGTIHSTPLHWATRQGHLPMVVQLMRVGADPTAVDGEGYQCIHLCSMFGHSKIVAYLVAKGYDVDTPDKNGMTPLMWACYRTASMDPTRLLITLGADVNKKDTQHGHTPLHWGLLVGNSTALNLLTKQNVDLDALNLAGQTSLDIAKNKKNRWMIERLAKKRLDSGLDNPGFVQRRTKYNRAFREKYMIGYPFFALWAVGWTFEMDYWWCFWWVRFLLLGLVYLSWKYSKQHLFDERLGNTIPFGLYMATKFWMYFTWFFYALPYIDSLLLHAAFFATTVLLVYNFSKSVRCDPGYLRPSREQQHQAIMELSETSTLTVEDFCSTCILRKPLRSKHCSICDKCVAMFDHHCPWIYNCVGASNVRYFVLYLTYLIGMILWCAYGCITFWLNGCGMASLGMHDIIDVIRCSPWVSWIFLHCCVHLVFVGILLSNMVYQIAYLGITTNENINKFRYKHLKKDGVFYNPFNRGPVQNCVDTMRWSCCGLCRPSHTDWKTVYKLNNNREYV